MHTAGNVCFSVLWLVMLTLERVHGCILWCVLNSPFYLFTLLKVSVFWVFLGICHFFFSLTPVLVKELLVVTFSCSMSCHLAAEMTAVRCGTMLEVFSCL